MYVRVETVIFFLFAALALGSGSSWWRTRAPSTPR